MKGNSSFEIFEKTAAVMIRVVPLLATNLAFPVPVGRGSWMNWRALGLPESSAMSWSTTASRASSPWLQARPSTCWTSSSSCPGTTTTASHRVCRSVAFLFLWKSLYFSVISGNERYYFSIASFKSALRTHILFSGHWTYWCTDCPCACVCVCVCRCVCVYGYVCCLCWE